MLDFKKNLTHLHSNQLKLSPVSESSTHPLLHYICFFPLTSRSGSYTHAQTYSLSLPLEWSQVAHIPTSIKLGGAYKPEKSSFLQYCIFARQLCDDTCLPGWLFAFPPHSPTLKPTQASFAHTIANHHIQ